MAGSWRRGEVAVGLALAGLGIAVAVLAAGMPGGTLALPGPGFAPAAVGVLLAIVGLGCAIRALVPTDAPDAPLRVGTSAVWGSLLTLAATAVAFEPLGAPLTLAAAMAALFRLIGGYSALRCLGYGAIAAAAAWIVFARLLGIGLPAGVLPL